MNFEIIRDIFLVTFGAFVTFIFTILTRRLQRKRPNIIWKKFPNLEISKQGVSGLSWLIENIGKKSARDVRITFTLPNEASFDHFEIEFSEAATEYYMKEDSTSKKLITVPIFSKGISLSVSCLVSDLKNKPAEISIIGEDVIGTKKPEKSEDFTYKMSKLEKTLVIVYYGILTSLLVFAFAFTAIMSNERLQFEQTKSIATLYLQSHDYEGAIQTYEELRENSLLLRNSPAINFNLAKAYALQNDAKKCTAFLKLAINKNVSIKNLIITDKAFDSVRNSNEFIEFLKSIEKSPEE